MSPSPRGSCLPGQPVASGGSTAERKGRELRSTRDFLPAFVETIKSVGVKTVKLPPQSPNLRGGDSDARSTRVWEVPDDQLGEVPELEDATRWKILIALSG